MSQPLTDPATIKATVRKYTGESLPRLSHTLWGEPAAVVIIAP